MPSPYPADPLGTLTDKQFEALGLVAGGFTSKEAARELGIAPKTFDHRIEAVCRKLDCATRVEAARIYGTVMGDGGNSPYPPFPIPDRDDDRAGGSRRSEEELLTFADAAPTFVERAPWEHDLIGRVPDFRPSRLGSMPRLLLIAGGAVVIAAVALLMIGIANGLEELVVQ